MRKLSTVIILSFTLYLYANAQSTRSADSPRQLISNLKNAKNDSSRVELLLKLGGYYLFKPGEFKNDLDSAMINFDSALKLSQKCHFKKGELDTYLIMGDWCIEAGDFQRAKSYYVKVANEYRSIGDKLNEALTWKEFGSHIDYNDVPHMVERESAFKHEYDLFKQIPGKQIAVINAYKDIADVHLNQRKYKLAETELLKVAGQFENIRYLKLYPTYFLLAEVYKATGDFEKRLYFNIECVKSMERDAEIDLSEKARYYFELGLAYYALRDNDQCVVFEKKALEISKRANFYAFYVIIAQITYALEASKKRGEALSFLRSQEAIHAPETDDEKRKVAELTLRCNLELKQYDAAGKVVPDLMKIYADQLKKLQLHSNYNNGCATGLSLIDRYYLATKQIHNAAIVLDELLTIPQQKLSAPVIIGIYSLQYKMDSIHGDYLASLRNYSKMALVKDSIAYYEKNEQVAKMNARFKTYQKEQAIQLLNKKNSDQQARLKKASIRQNYTIGAGVLLFVIAGLTFNGFRNKQRSNKKLKKHQQEINRKNDSLAHLLKEQEKLLIEKNWLLKEVNHRVKNNLHMVISLLESQAMSLENDALNAMQTSKHRIFSMSLIHQKLYQSVEAKTIDMSVYLPEFVNYLRDSFDAGKYIHFGLEVEPVQLSVAQAIPLALILNEAITNSVKYAFPGNRLGEISIKMRQTGENIELIIRDNGIGMVKVREDRDLDSLGLKLMRGLIEEIGGQINFKNNNGTIISIIFKGDLLVENYPFSNLSIELSGSKLL